MSMKAKASLALVFKILLGVAYITPIILAVLFSFQPNEEIGMTPLKLISENPTLEHYKYVLENIPVLTYLKNTVIMMLICIPCQVIFAALGAYSFAFFNYKGKNLLFSIYLASMMIPGDVVIMSNYMTIQDWGLMNTYIGMSITSLVGVTGIFMLRQNMKSLPKELWEAAKVDGCKEMKYFFKVVLPLSTPVISSMAINSFIGIYNAYFWPMLVTTEDSMRDPNDTASETLDFSQLVDLNMGDAATFTNVTMKMPTEKIFANGHRLEIAEGVSTTTNTPNVYGGSETTAVESTDVTLHTGSYGNIYAGGNSKSVYGNTNLYIGGDVELSTKTVYGGCYNNTVSGDTHITIGGNAKVQYVRGAGNAGNAGTQSVEGTCYVTIEGSAQIEGVNGGGAGGSTNNTYVVVNGGTIEQVIGGQTTSGGTVNNTNVYILDGTITRRIYGGTYNNYENLSWQSSNSVAGYSSVTIDKKATISSRSDDNIPSDTSICAVSRSDGNLGTEKGIMILNYGVDSSEIGFSSAVDWINGSAICSHFQVNVDEGGIVTSESGVLRIKPNIEGTYAIVTDPSGNKTYLQGEGTYPLSGLTTSSEPQTLTVEFIDTIDTTLSGNYVLSYGDNSYSYFDTLSAAMAAVSTPKVDDIEEKIAVITIAEVADSEIEVSETYALTNGKRVILKNETGNAITLKRAEGFTDSMFTIDNGCSLEVQGDTENTGITIDGASIVAKTAMIENAGTFTTGSCVTLKNAIHNTEDTGSYGGALYNTGIATLKGNVTGNSAYRGGAIYATGAVSISGNITTNTSTNQGGAIYVTSAGTVTLTSDGQAEISDNAAGDHGGAIYVAGTLLANQYQFNGNKCTNTNNNNARGGAIYISENADVTNCIFGAEGNGNASGYGGAIFVAGKLSADSCTFQYNTSKTSGGAIGLYGNAEIETVITGSTFTSNTASAYGGAVDVNGGTDKIQVQGCTFTGNGNASGGTISVRASGKNIDIADSTFDGDALGNTDVIYFHVAENTVGISGKISKAIVQSNAKTASTPQVLINGYLDSTSDITLTPKTYSNEEFVVAKANDEVATTTYEKAINIMKVTQPTGKYWFVQNNGYLSDVVAKVNGTESSYENVLTVIADTETSSVIIEFLRNIEIASTISIPANKNVTITNVAGQDVTITRAVDASLFVVADGSSLTLGSEGATNKLIIDGGYVADAETPLEAASLVSNAGTFTLEANATIQNAVFEGVSGKLGGALNNAAGATATIKGTILGCSAFNGGAIYNAGNVTVTESASFVGNVANVGNGGAIRNVGTLTITGATFTSNQGLGKNGNGGAIYNTGSLTTTDVVFERNTARSGGAIYNEKEGIFKIVDGIFKANKANIGSGTGGAIYIRDTSATTCAITGAEFTQNSSTDNKSAAIDAQQAVVLTDCNIHNNVSSETSENAIYDVQSGNVTLTLGGITTIDAVYQAHADGRVHLLSEFTGEIALVPNAYTIGTEVVTFAEEAEDTAALVSKVVVREYDSQTEYQDDVYCVDANGMLQYKNAEAKLGNITYLTFTEAIEAAVDGDTVIVMKDIEVCETIAIDKNLTITNVEGKDVTITRAVDASLFTIAEGITLTLGSEDATNKLIVDGGYVADAETPLEAASLVSNAGTFTLEANATIQNAVFEGVSGNLGGALNNAAGATATIKGAICGCSAFNGGAIYNAGNVTVTESASFVGNIANVGNGGAIRNIGTLTITGATFTGNQGLGKNGNGGAIYNTGSLTTTDVMFERNTARSGGAIYNEKEGTFKIVDGIFKENKANIGSGTGGAIYIRDTSATTCTITGTEFTQNSSTDNKSAAIDAQQAVVLTDCNIHDNVSSETSENAVYDVQVGNAILTLGGTTTIDTVYQGNASGRVHLLSGFTGEIALVPNAYTIGTEVVTFAEEAEDTATLANRVLVGKVASGKVYHSDKYYIDDDGMLQAYAEVAKVGDIRYATLEEAIAAVETSENATVYLLNDATVSTILTIGTESAPKKITITSAAGEDITLTRTADASMFTVANGSTLIIGSEGATNKLIVDGGYVADAETPLEADSLVSNAGTFTLEANATIQNAVFEGVSGNLGGALNNAAGATATIKGTICGCSAFNGGAIYNAPKGTVIIEDSAVLSENKAVNGNGGAIRNEGSLEITKATFRSNKGEGTSKYLNGGAIYNTGTLTATDVTFEGNTGRSGGAIYNEKSTGTFTINGGMFKGNKANIGEGTGGAIYIHTDSAATCKITGTEFLENSSTSNNSAAINVGKTLVLTDCNIHDNVSSETSENAVYDVQVGNAILTLGGTTAIDTVYQGNASGKVHLLSDFTGEITLVPNSYETESQVVTFAEGIEDTATLASKILVGELNSGQVQPSEVYYVDTAGRLQKSEQEATE